MPSIARWDEIADRYAADAAEAASDTGPVGGATLDLAAPKAGESALDLACGPGHLSRHLARAGLAVTGVDASARLLERARADATGAPLEIRYVEADAADPQLLAGHEFDLVICSMAISDIDNLAGALTNVVRLLVSDGRFVFSILHPCFPGAGSSLPSWPSAGYYAEGWWLPEGHHGYRGVVGANHRTLATYLNALAAHGLRVDCVAEPAPEGITVPMFLVARAIKI